MDFTELRDTTIDPVSGLVQVTMEQASIADDICSILMGEWTAPTYIQTTQRTFVSGHLILKAGWSDQTAHQFDMSSEAVRTWHEATETRQSGARAPATTATERLSARSNRSKSKRDGALLLEYSM